MSLNRTNQILDRVKKLLNDHGEEAKRVIRFEFLNYKRLMRPTTKDMWTPQRISDKAFFRKVYRLETDHEDDEWWADVLGSTQQSCADQTTTTKVQAEYARTVLEKNAYYIIPIQRQDVDNNGDVVDVVEDAYFQMLTTRSASSNIL